MLAVKYICLNAIVCELTVTYSRRSVEARARTHEVFAGDLVDAALADAVAIYVIVTAAHLLVGCAKVTLHQPYRRTFLRASCM